MWPPRGALGLVQGCAVGGLVVMAFLLGRLSVREGGRQPLAAAASSPPKTCGSNKAKGFAAWQGTTPWSLNASLTEPGFGGQPRRADRMLDERLAAIPTTTRGSINTPRGLSTTPRGSINTPRGLSTTPRGFATRPRGLRATARGLSTMPRGVRTTARGLSTTSRGVRTTARGLSTMPRGVRTGPRGLLKHPRVLATPPRRPQTTAAGIEPEPYSRGRPQSLPQGYSESLRGPLRLPSTGRGVKRVNLAPAWLGDTYGEEETYTHSQCPDGVRARVRHVAWLAPLFEARVPVLMWNEHAEWGATRARLAPHLAPHGWKNVSLAVIQDALSVLDSPANRYLFDAARATGGHGVTPAPRGHGVTPVPRGHGVTPAPRGHGVTPAPRGHGVTPAPRGHGVTPTPGGLCVRCAVVGSAPALRGSGLGPEIDRHDHVFRLRGVPTRDSARDLGSRTSFLTLASGSSSGSTMDSASHGPPALRAARSERHRRELQAAAPGLRALPAQQATPVASSEHERALGLPAIHRRSAAAARPAHLRPGVGLRVRDARLRAPPSAPAARHVAQPPRALRASRRAHRGAALAAPPVRGPPAHPHGGPTGGPRGAHTGDHKGNHMGSTRGPHGVHTGST
ncbi:nascent polypeptide-associated complex subunit alpha, muscle-specific form-like isoform X5 [Lethenteron reissneri]|uniref:nascent polypeptide-associated complex subunit alpha, muscle-specific form-like isoform X5 n=1 Tax=Lethenteron reissneri TaxID=7753 RepID=UPI002AB636E7|nr:nascent polypeptide-associated complex subunit alpha, muscle-specific form-like isoform X5 [Lethenteron reissneri]XP_061433208.1 nascent polypeptide-associated complex subunit alpha, muscle-specific form-like isoform X5 [Lethenteron reissneri]